MAETEKTSYEKAKSCPICGEYGILEATNPGPRFGSKVETYLCDNQLCRWYKTGWVVQLNKDGSIPDRRKGTKDFPVMPDSFRQAHEDYLEQLKQREGL